VDVFNGLGNLMLRPFGIPPAREAGHAPHSEQELLELLAESGEHGLIEAEEQELAERGFAFADRTARDVMQAREAIEFVPLDAPIRLAAQHAARAGHTRLPVCEPERGLDAPWGLVHVHDLLAAVLREPAGELRGLLRPLPRVDEDTPVTTLLERMRDEGRQMVLVRDGRGVTVGLVTLEDLLEELVGEIEDEAPGRVPSLRRAAR
jgi:CBS domain containing-hemolysin-like protein